jgi:hypothetical protein
LEAQVAVVDSVVEGRKLVGSFSLRHEQEEAQA